jgi:hypothetical protein
MRSNPRRHGPHTDVGLPEIVGFALGAGAMATAMAALEASLSENETARRLVRNGILTELHRMAAERAPGARTAAPRPRSGPTVTWRHAA